MSGSNTINQPGIYGTKGVAAASNTPGARDEGYSITGSDGNLWLFGGSGYDSTGVRNYLNDLWRWDGTNWTWMSGSNIALQSANHGIKGVPAASNTPGAGGGTFWADSSGNLWLFGGSGIGSGGSLNTLWRWDGANWTWMSGSNLVNQSGTYGTKGIPAASNTPGSGAGTASWTDGNSNMWLFGGYGYDSTGVLGYHNELWRWDGTSWTWMSGSNLANQSGIYGTKGIPAASNTPGSRYLEVSWTDRSDDLWLFGGIEYDSSTGVSVYLDDLWRWDGTNWTWMSGSNLANQSGIYGTKGIPAATNTPGARSAGVSWTDSSGDLWLLGDKGYDSTGLFSYLNDLWRWDGTNWTWMSGSNLDGQPGIFGTKGVPATNNTPGWGIGRASWTDNKGNQWLFGGLSYAGGEISYLNALWRWDGTNWTWMSGGNVGNQPPIYGTKGVAAAENTPGSKEGSASFWTDSDGNLWLFGGDSFGNGLFNDLWFYQP